MSDEKVPENSTPAGSGRWPKGISGNPGGRRKLVGEEREAMQLARKYGKRAVRRLAQLMRSKNDRVAVAAAVALLDRGYGKPAQTISSGNGAPLVNINIGNGQPIRNAHDAAQVYASILGNVHADLSGITFAEPEPPTEVLAKSVISVVEPTERDTPDQHASRDATSPDARLARMDQRLEAEHEHNVGTYAKLGQ